MRRAVVDTNVWVSALLSPTGGPGRVLEALEAGEFIFVTSEPLLAELAEVLRRPRIARKYLLTDSGVDAFVSRLRRRAILMPVSGAVHLCRDPDDDLVIETAAVGQANVLVTRDDDLKGDPELVRLLRAAGLDVLSVRRFLAELDDPAAGLPHTRD